MGLWWKVYVIELRDDPTLGLRRDPSKPHVYVGRTTRSREQRLKVHIGEANGRGNSVVTKANVVGLRNDLVEGIRATRDEAQADALEAQLIKSLCEQGFTVHGSPGTPWMHRGAPA